MYITSAPNSSRVSISTAVWIVICRQPPIRAPLSGCVFPYFFLKDIRPGISSSASIISFRPHSARFMSAVKNHHYIQINATAACSSTLILLPSTNTSLAPYRPCQVMVSIKTQLTFLHPKICNPVFSFIHVPTLLGGFDIICGLWNLQHPSISSNRELDHAFTCFI